MHTNYNDGQGPHITEATGNFAVFLCGFNIYNRTFLRSAQTLKGHGPLPEEIAEQFIAKWVKEVEDDLLDATFYLGSHLFLLEAGGTIPGATSKERLENVENVVSMFETHRDMVAEWRRILQEELNQEAAGAYVDALDQALACLRRHRETIEKESAPTIAHLDGTKLSALLPEKWRKRGPASRHTVVKQGRQIIGME